MTKSETSIDVDRSPRVSVVMGVHNDADRVENAVSSILQQTFADLELIVVNDGSHDESGSLLDRLAATDDRLRVIHQENAGLTQALIRGCAEAKGEFIARQDSDDWSHPKRLAEQVALIEADEGIGFVSCPTQYVGPRGEPLMVISRSADSEQATRGLREERQGPPAHGSVLFKRSLYALVGGYRPQFYFAQDSDLWLRMAEHARIAYLAEIRYVHLRETESTSGAQRPTQRQFGEIGQLCRQARKRGTGEDELLARAAQLTATITSSRGASNSAAKEAVADAAYFIGSQLVANGDRRARPYLLEAIGLRPWHWKAWIRLAQSLRLKQPS
jgi:glycosyltransferase involved in cell wall biosynthesis